MDTMLFLETIMHRYSYTWGGRLERVEQTLLKMLFLGNVQTWRFSHKQCQPTRHVVDLESEYQLRLHKDCIALKCMFIEEAGKSQDKDVLVHVHERR
jgi:hypothetical protein